MHPLRHALHNELHARPSLYFSEPAHVFHLAIIGSECDRQSLLNSLYTEPVDDDLPQGIIRLDGHWLKWERHAEFFTLTYVVTASTDSPQWISLPDALAAKISPFTQLLINRVQIVVRNQSAFAGDHAQYGFKDPCGSSIGGGDASVWSDFRLSECGENRFLFVNHHLNAYRQGRMIRRLLEIETYRMMASLSLPAAKQLSSQLNAFDRTLADLSERNAAPGASNAKALLTEIAALSAKVVSLSAKYRHRFSATQAYAQLVFERLAELREDRAGDCQRLGIFIERRFKPTVRYCAVTEQRLDVLAKSVANLGDLLQARVQVEMEEQNAEILKSLNIRADAQIKIQRAVEGLSIIAITYYVLNLLIMLFSGMHLLGMDLSPRSAVIGMAPIAAFILMQILIRIRVAKQH
ncbi:DUF3422 domain-containing protein [Pseudomonas putida]|jgi:uncharacterized membrane-anchored protein|uniref:DUF3422 domain-containing protein n=1 Tax=Pseudomonas putida TaxID=303 RepID=UPI000981A401|nr:DUF3422 domain-containing protein [Pseudomonas putida]MBH2033623.1 DUF3422 domain-containing protein [Pseudomonadales bacterium]OMQ41091.1 hypothetical protein BKX96_04685 [Pseudomonas putida]